ncbi:MAG: 5-carboxymethyl-2-hydroxymuconate semialdehyde dehydrogenase, partial [Microbacterium sp.]|nr:5-carboxymethyl-2-hydroxymuconate semialdehyde dehydrogenase [Microbacterium sp.]
MTDTTLTAPHTPADLPGAIRHYIDGSLVDSVDGVTFDVLDPVTGRVYLQAAAGKKADVDAAVAAARRAFTEGPWPRMLPRERSRVLHRIADLVESRDARLAELESFDSGLPITQALGQARRAAENFRFFADLIVAQADDTYKVPGRQINYVNRKP